MIEKMGETKALNSIDNIINKLKYIEEIAKYIEDHSDIICRNLIENLPPEISDIKAVEAKNVYAKPAFEIINCALDNIERVLSTSNNTLVKIKNETTRGEV